MNSNERQRSNVYHVNSENKLRVTHFGRWYSKNFKMKKKQLTNYQNLNRTHPTAYRPYKHTKRDLLRQ